MLEAKDTGGTNTKKNDVRLQQAPEMPALLTQIMSLKEGKIKKKSSLVMVGYFGLLEISLVRAEPHKGVS